MHTLAAVQKLRRLETKLGLAAPSTTSVPENIRTKQSLEVGKDEGSKGRGMRGREEDGWCGSNGSSRKPKRVWRGEKEGRQVQCTYMYIYVIHVPSHICCTSTQ
jgi:hypothetical protein